MTRYLPSSSPGKSWSISFVKPQGRPGFMSAIEGEYERTAFGDSFKFMLFGARSVRQPIIGPCTAKKKAAAEAELIATLKAQGYLAAEAA